jgi:hypothetical protein
VRTTIDLDPTMIGQRGWDFHLHPVFRSMEIPAVTAGADRIAIHAGGEFTEAGLLGLHLVKSEPAFGVVACYMQGAVTGLGKRNHDVSTAPRSGYICGHDIAGENVGRPTYRIRVAVTLRRRSKYTLQGRTGLAGVGSRLAGVLAEKGV